MTTEFFRQSNFHFVISVVCYGQESGWPRDSSLQPAVWSLSQEPPNTVITVTLVYLLICTTPTSCCVCVTCAVATTCAPTFHTCPRYHYIQYQRVQRLSFIYYFVQIPLSYSPARPGCDMCDYVLCHAPTLHGILGRSFCGNFCRTQCAADRSRR